MNVLLTINTKKQYSIISMYCEKYISKKRAEQLVKDEAIVIC